MKIKNIFICLAVLQLIFSCGNEPPVISLVNYNVLVYQKDGLINTDDAIYLSVYFVIDDANGLNDIKTIKVTHLQSEYSWILSRDILKTPTVWRDKNYVGYPFLKYDDAKSILTGEYVVEAEDYSGNVARSSFFVEMPGTEPNEEYSLKEIKYRAELVNNNRELKISGDDFSSCEIRFLNEPAFFNGGRKKFTDTKKIVLNNGDPMPPNTKISVRINRDDMETDVFFLKNVIVK